MWHGWPVVHPVREEFPTPVIHREAHRIAVSGQGSPVVHARCADGRLPAAVRAQRRMMRSRGCGIATMDGVPRGIRRPA